MKLEELKISLNEGLQAKERLDLELALEKFSEAIEKLEKEKIITPKRSEIYVKLLSSRGKIYKTIGRWDDAMLDFQKVEELCHDTLDKIDLVKSLLDMGELQNFSGEYQSAVPTLLKATDLAKDMGNVLLSAESCFLLGATYSRIGEHQEGKKYLEKGIAFLESEEPTEEAREILAKILCEVGLSHFREGRIDEAMNYYKKSLALIRQPYSSLQAAEDYRYVGVVNSLKGDFKAGLANHMEALKIYVCLGDIYGKAKVYSSIGQTFFSMSMLNEALFFMEKAESLAKLLGAEALSATLYGKIGDVYLQQGDYDKAIDFYNQDMEISKRFGNYRALAHTYKNLGRSYIYKGEFTKGVNFLQESYERFQELQDNYNTAKVLSDIAWAHLSQKNWLEAENVGKKALKLCEAHPQIPHLAYVKFLLGVINRLKKEWDLSRKFLEESIEMLMRKEPTYQLCDAFYELGVLYLERQEPTKALRSFKDSLSVARELGLKSKVLQNLGEIEMIDETEVMDIYLNEMN